MPPSGRRWRASLADLFGFESSGRLSRGTALVANARARFRVRALAGAEGAPVAAAATIAAAVSLAQAAAEHPTSARSPRRCERSG